MFCLFSQPDCRNCFICVSGTLSGDFLPAQLIYQGKTEACHPVYDFPLAWNITHSDNHWANKQTQLQYTKRVLLPHMKKTKKRLGLPESQQALCIFDVFRAQMSEDFLNDLKKHNISIVYVPPSCTDRLQPMDLTVQKVVKDKLKDSFQQWYASKITKQLESGKEICDLKPVDLRLSHVKPLSAKWIFDAHAQVKADRKLVFKGFEKAGIAEALDYEFEM